MHDRFGHAEEHQADAHARGKQHGEPTAVAVVRHAVVRPQLDIAVATHGQEHHADQDQGDRQNVEPAGIGVDPALDVVELRLGLGLKHHGIKYQQQNEYRAGVENRRIERTLRLGRAVHESVVSLAAGRSKVQPNSYLGSGSSSVVASPAQAAQRFALVG
ncbi:hypothetical protein D3C84_885490 [compost metagenome]